MSPVSCLRPTLADRCSEGAQAAGESLRGSAALPPEGGRTGGKAHQGAHPACATKKSVHSQMCGSDGVFFFAHPPLLPLFRWSPSFQS